MVTNHYLGDVFAKISASKGSLKVSDSLKGTFRHGIAVLFSSEFNRYVRDQYTGG